jgi:hypothetical protein
MPSYKRMVCLFRDHLSLACPDTIAHFDKLVRFAGVWDHFADHSIPREAIGLLELTEEELRPFYANLQRHHDELVAKIASAQSQ